MKRKFFLCLLSAGPLFLLAAGCRSARPPAGWEEPWTPDRSEENVAGADEVWKEIEQTSVPAGEELGLSDLAALALKNNPSTRRAWASAAAAAAQVETARGSWYPQLSLSGGGGYQKQDYTLREGAPENLNADLDQYSYGPSAKLNWLLLDLGGRSGRVEGAWQELLAAGYEFNQAIQDVLLDVEKAYFNYDAAVSGLEAAQANLTDAETSLQAARDRVASGLASDLDALQAESNYYNSSYSLEEARGTLQAASASLKQTVGLSAGTDLPVKAPPADPPGGIPDDAVEVMIETAIGERPDLAALRSRVLAAEASLAAAESDLWPSLGVSADAQKNWYEYKSGPELYDESWGFGGFLTLSWDIFSGFSDLGKKRAAAAQLAGAREQLRQAEILSSSQVWTAYYDYLAAAGKFQAARAYYAASASSYDLALQSYEQGLKSLLDLLQAQSDLSTARSRLTGSRRDVYTALAVLAHATGRLSSDRLAPGTAAH